MKTRIRFLSLALMMVLLCVLPVFAQTGYAAGDSISIPGGTLTISDGGVASLDGTTSYTLDADSTITSTGNLEIILNNTNAVTIKSITLGDATLTISGAGVLNVVNDDTSYGSAAVKLANYSAELLMTGGTLNATGETYGVWSFGSITVTGGTVIGTSSASGEGGVRADGNITVNSGGVLEGTGDYYGVHGSAITVNSGGMLKGTDGSAYGVWGYSITVDGGSLAGTSTDAYGVYASGFAGITVKNSGVLEGTSTGSNYRTIGVGSTCIEVDNATLAGTGGDIGVCIVQMLSRSVTPGQLIVRNGGTLTGLGDIYGVCNNGYNSLIKAESGGKITGTAPHFGVYANNYGTIVADGTGSEVKGVATASSRVYEDDYDTYDTSAVMFSPWTSGGTITATNGGLIWEHYPNMPLAFDETNPKHPYENGVNVDDFTNYGWSHGLVPSADASGLVATQGYSGTQTITGERTAAAQGESAVTVDGGTHRISFPGTVAGPITPEGYTVTYNANDGTGRVYADTGLSAGNYTVKTLGQAGFSRSGYVSLGWNTEPGGGGTSYTAGSTLTLAGNLTLYAQWRLDEITPIPSSSQPPVVIPQTGANDTLGFGMLLLFLGAAMALALLSPHFLRKEQRQK